MVDLRGQYLAIKDEIDAAIAEVLDETHFIRGPVVGQFECELAGHLGGSYVHGVANGTDALQIAFMALGIGPGDEVLTSAFTFVATTRFSMGSPILAATYPANTSPKFPVGTLKATLRSGAPSWSAAAK